MITIEQILGFLNEKPGYRKESPQRLQAKVCNYFNDTTTYNNCKSALSKFRKVYENSNVSENNLRSNFDKDSEDKDYLAHLKRIGLTKEDVESVKYWQTSSGELRFSVIPFKNKKQKDHHFVLEEFKKYIDTYPTPSELLYEVSCTSTTGVSVIADLHVGAWVNNMKLTPNFNIDILKTRLELTSKLINSSYNKENYIFIQGDLVEGITGLNHKNQWKQMELYGADVLIAAFELLRFFLLKIKNLKGVYIVGGNHDRLTSDNTEDTEASGAKLISYFLSKEFPSIDFEFSDTVITRTIDKINYVATHGHLGLSKKNIESLLLNYAPKNNYYNVAISAHLHTKNRTVGLTDTIINDSASYSGYIAPPLFTGNDYSEKGGWTSTAGFMEFQNVFNMPKVTYIPLK